MFPICQKRQLNPNVTALTFAVPLVANKVQPGQFVMIRIDDRGERIPLTVADFDRTAGTLTVMVQAIGKTTKQLAALSTGDSVADVVGPLGCPTAFGEPKRAVVIGGGVGCAIAYPQAKALHERGVSVDVIAGFRTRDIVMLEDEMKAVANRLVIATDDGSYGERGFVTDILSRFLQTEAYDLAVAIGPVPMMRAVCEVTRPSGLRTLVSLNPIMIDGTGMCGGCRVTVDGQMKFACVDGPDFDGHKVDFEELSRRNAFYREQEAHACRLWEENHGR